MCRFIKKKKYFFGDEKEKHLCNSITKVFFTIFFITLDILIYYPYNNMEISAMLTPRFGHTDPPLGIYIKERKT
jgi:hypothetical protein